MKAYPIYMLVYITAIAYSWLMHVNSISFSHICLEERVR